MQKTELNPLTSLTCDKGRGCDEIYQDTTCVCLGLVLVNLPKEEGVERKKKKSKETEGRRRRNE